MEEGDPNRNIDAAAIIISHHSPNSVLLDSDEESKMFLSPFGLTEVGCTYIAR